MPVTDDHVALLRAYLTAQDDGKRLNLFQAPDLAPVYGLVSATFAKAMKATFSEHRHDPRAPIIRFVGAMRAKSTRAVRIEPRIAERLIDLALGRTSDRPAGPANAHATRLRILRAMVEDEVLDVAGLDDLLRRARHLADLRLSFRHGVEPESWTERAFLADLLCDETTFQAGEERYRCVDLEEHAKLVRTATCLLLDARGRHIDVVGLVGEVRARSTWWADHVDPRTAERIVRNLERGRLPDADPAIRRTVRLLVRALADEAWLEDAERYDLLLRAREAVQ